MKKTIVYKTGALCLAFLSVGVFTAFDDAQTDEQKIEAAYTQLVTDFKMEQDQLCKTQALAEAQTQWMEIQKSMAEGGATSSSGGNEKPTSTSSSSQGSNNTSSSSSSSSTGNDQKTDPPVTTTTTTPKDGKAGKMNGTSTSGSTNTSDKKAKMSGDSKSGSSNTNKKKDKMNGK